MRRSRRFSVDFQDAVDTAARNLTKDEAIEKLAEKAYFSYPAPDLIDRARAIAFYPCLCIQRILHQPRAKRGAVNQ